MCNSNDAIKRFVIVFFSNSKIKNLSNEDWNRWFTILELKYPDYLYSCTLFCILNEWTTYYNANQDNFTYEPECIR